jgi:hypothetical protein
MTWSAKATAALVMANCTVGSRRCDVRGHSVETELVALDVLHHDARLVVVIGQQ